MARVSKTCAGTKEIVPTKKKKSPLSPISFVIAPIPSPKPVVSSCTNKTGKQRILDFALALEESPEIGAPRHQLLSLCGIKTNTFTVTLSGLKKNGLIEYTSTQVRLTDAGRLQADGTTIVADNSSVQAKLKEQHKLGTGLAGQLFDQLLNGEIHDRSQLAVQIGCTNKATFAVLLSNLKKKGILQYDKTTIRLTDICFPFGRSSGNNNV